MESIHNGESSDREVEGMGSEDYFDFLEPEEYLTGFSRTKIARKANRGTFGVKGRATALRRSNSLPVKPRGVSRQESNSLIPTKKRAPRRQHSFSFASGNSSLDVFGGATAQCSIMPRSLSTPPVPPRRFNRRCSSATEFDRRIRSSTSSSPDDSSTTGSNSGVAENRNPNKDNFFEGGSGDNQRERKKFRSRRHSIGRTFPPPLCGNTKAGSEPSSFQKLALTSDPQLAWILERSPSTAGRSMYDISESTTSTHSSSNNMAYPSPLSTSSRKRSVYESDTDECSGVYSVSSQSPSRRSRRRSRLSPELGRKLPYAPCLAVKTKEECHRDQMEEESDDDDCDNESDSPSSPECSFDLGYEEQEDIASAQSVESQKGILETMSCYDDLKFLIKALQRERDGRPAFGSSNYWTVAPPISWSPKRRSAFLRWTSSRLGFSVRSASESVTYLQTSKTKGVEVYAQLREALVEYKQMNAPAVVEHSVEEVSKFVETKLSASSVASTGFNNTRRLFDLNSGGEECGEEATLLAQMQQLSMIENQKKSQVTETNSTVDTKMVRTVTLQSNSSSRLSIESHFQASVASRHSLETHFETTDLMSHLHGNYSPLDNPRERFRLSLASVHSTLSEDRDRASGQFQNLGMMQSQEIVETPLMNDNDDGWGSCPIQGRDWGGSCRCDDSVLEELFSRFRDSVLGAGLRDSFGSTPNLLVAERPSNLQFELCHSEPILEVTPDTPNTKIVAAQRPTPKTAEKISRRRKESMAKRHRMSLWSTATQPTLPLKVQKPRSPILERARLLRSPRADVPFDEAPPMDDELDTSMVGMVNEPASRLSFDGEILSKVFSFLTEGELLSTAGLVSTTWADAAVSSHAALMYSSIGHLEEADNEEHDAITSSSAISKSVAMSMERSWDHMVSTFPWACYLADGAFKRVYKVYNATVHLEEALSVMDLNQITDTKTVGAELAVSAMLSSLARRGICPNFIITRGVFNSGFEPPASHWGSSEDKRPRGKVYDDRRRTPGPSKPKTNTPGRYQYIRMELCNEGDAEEFLKRQNNEMISPSTARALVFQTAFALHTAAHRFSVKHYDIKLLNLFIQKMEDVSGRLILEYGLGAHTYSLVMPKEEAIIAKLADYGTANVDPESNERPVTIAQFTTLENTPPDFMILGDEAKQGHGHDCFGLGLCMLHLFTGHAPYEEILEDVECPSGLKKRLAKIWENDNMAGYGVIRSVVLADVYKDEAGRVVEGEPDETMYHTLYRFLVLFGIPDQKPKKKITNKVWKAIIDSLGCKNSRAKKKSLDAAHFARDRRKYSIQFGSNKYICRARKSLESMDGGMDILLRLCSFDPSTRASALEVLNSPFMASLRKPVSGVDDYDPSDSIQRYMAYSMQR